MRSRRWVSVWSWNATGARSIAAPIASASASGGSSQRPPNSPWGVRRASTISPASSIHTTVLASSGSSDAFLRAATTGSSSWRPVRAASHAVASGHARQRGCAGAQIVAPSSIRPWFRSPGAAPAGSACISCPAAAHSAFCPAVDLMSSPSANTRASTRATLPSTRGARSPNAIDAIAPAVYGPIPGTARSSAAHDGSAPPNRASTSRAPACRLRARE
jgi:hypothetical protein